MRLAMGIAYRGTHYYGWQRQRHSDNTVQFHVEKAIAHTAAHDVKTFCAGRTDSGVHAAGQVIHFDSCAKRSLRGWCMGVNTRLPKDIRVGWVKEVDADFHARFSAVYRRYQYVVDDTGGSAIFNELSAPCRQPLSSEKMHQAAQYLLGEQDFSSFRAAQCQSNTPFRRIDFINVYRSQARIIIDIRANAFLYHMVRNIVGALMLVGCGKHSPEWIDELLAAKDRRKAPATATAKGLYLIAVGYPTKYGFPDRAETLPFSQH